MLINVESKEKIKAPHNWVVTGGFDRWITTKTASNAESVPVSWRHHVPIITYYSEVILNTMASQITGVSIVYSTVCSDADQRKYQSSASQAFVRGIHRWPVNSPAQSASNAENASIWWHHYANTSYHSGGEYGKSRSVPYLPMFWLFVSTGQQLLWYCICCKNGPLSYTRNDFYYLCHLSGRKWYKMQIYFHIP